MREAEIYGSGRCGRLSRLDKVLLSVPGRDFSVWPFMKNLSLKDFQIQSPGWAAHSITAADSALPCFNPPLELFCKFYFAFDAAL